MSKVVFKEIENHWFYTLEDGTTGKVDKDIIEKYIKPQCVHIYSSQYYLDLNVDIPGFGEHVMRLEIAHDNHETLKGVYFTIGGRDDEAFTRTSHFVI